MEKCLIDEPPPGFVRTEAVPVGWTEFFIAERYRPPKAVRYIALPHSDKRSCDLMRARYAAEGRVVTITQARGMFCVQVKSDHGEHKTDALADAQEIARSIFRNGGTIRLEAPASAQEPGAAEAGASPELPWIETMGWAKTDDGFAFWAFKDDGQPRTGSIGVTVEANEQWYSPWPKPANTSKD